MSSRDYNREFAVEVVRRLQQAGHQSLWAGGCVRDFLLGHAPDDYDVATSALPEQVQELFGQRRTLAVGASFGVMLVRPPRRLPARDIEVATFRTEGPYLDGRRPQHVAYATAEEDAQRRDFTINGMFFDPLTDKLYDYVGGRQDLERRIVRAIGNPRQRFAEDKLRMLRAVRITAKFDCALDPETAAATREMASELLVVSAERIAQELAKMLMHPERSRAMRLADELRLLAVVFPEFQTLIAGSCENSSSWTQTLEMLSRLEDPSFELALATLLFPLAETGDDESAGKLATTICRRLRLSNNSTERVRWLLEHLNSLAGAPTWPPARLKRLLAHTFIRDLLTLLRIAAECRSGPIDAIEFCEGYLESTPTEVINPAPLLTGDDLIALGLTPGTGFKSLLVQIRDAQLDGLIETHDEAAALAKKLASEQGH